MKRSENFDPGIWPIVEGGITGNRAYVNHNNKEVGGGVWNITPGKHCPDVIYIRFVKLTDGTFRIKPIDEKYKQFANVVLRLVDGKFIQEEIKK